MFQPLPCFIGLRYLRSRQRRGLVSFLSTASLAGIALGVAALIVILSVMNGLEGEFRSRLLSMTEHVSIRPLPPGDVDWDTLGEQLSGEAGVAGVAPFVQLQAMLSVGAGLRPVVLRGIDPEAESEASDIADIIGPEGLAALQAGSRHVILGRFVAIALGVDVGDTINVLLASMRGGRPDIKRSSFSVAGIFDAGVEDHDANLALTHIEDASVLGGFAGRPEGLALRLSDAMLARQYQDRFEETLGSGFEVSNWADQNSSLFRAMAIEKTMMTIILMFIVGVAAFNIVASLMMVVNEKTKDIAILRTYGLEPGRVTQIFFFQGAMLGIAGTVLGTVLGIVLAANVETIVPWLEASFNFKIMPGDVFYVTEIPSEIQLADVTLVPAFALLISVLATVYPSRRAARVEPAEALRYE